MLVFLLLALVPVASFSDTHSAASLSPSDVQRAVDAASPGDVVVLPAGDYLGFNRTISVPNGVSIRGAGKDQTILRNTSATLFLFILNYYETTSSYKVKVSGFQLIGHGDSSGSGIELRDMTDFSVSDLLIKDFAGVGVGVSGDSRGVIYDCDFINICQSDLGGTGYGVAVNGNSKWDDPKPPLGTQNAVFVEDCYFNKCKHAIASNVGSHYVFRHNKVEGLRHNKQGVDAHGKQSTHPCGSNTYEIYNNTIIGSGSSSQTDWGIGVRGGSGVIFSNTISKCDPDTIPKAIAAAIDDHGSYPDKYQVRDLYVWNNTHDGSAITDVYVEGEALAYVKKNREYFMTKKSGYTSYAYPHPLRTSQVTLDVTADASPVSGIVPLTVAFSSQVTGGSSPYTYSWSFDDGGSSTAANPTHTYSSAGTYTAELTVRDNQGSTASDAATIIANATALPLSAAATATPSTGQAPLYVKFSSSVSGGVSPYTYSWSFGDGGSSTSANPSHTYSSEGTYAARFTVRDSQGSTASDSVTITATATPQPLSAEAAATPTAGQAPLYVKFTGSASGGVSPYTYSWNFGDGAYWGYQNPSHTYTAAGEYTATLTVTDSLRTVERASVTITVRPESSALVAQASASAQSGPPPLSVTFTGSAQGGTPPYSYRWVFGDGGSSSVQSPTHIYSAAGSYAAVLTVTDARSTTDSSTLDITVTTAATYNLILSAMTGAPAPGQGGTTSPAPGTHPYVKGGYAHVQARPKTDYRFSLWTGNIPAAGTYVSPITVTMDKNRSISATFCTKCADVNGDLKITPADAQAAFDLFLGKIKNPTHCESENADVNGSGTASVPGVTPADAQSIFNKYLKRADLVSNCSGASRMSAVPFLPVEPLGTVGLAVHQTLGERGEELIVPVIVDSLLPMGAFGFDLSFPSPGLTFIGVENTEATSGFTQVGAQLLTPGVVRVGGYAVEPVYPAAPYVLVTLVFRVNRRVPYPFVLSIVTTYDDLLRVQVRNDLIPQDVPLRELPDKRTRQKKPAH